MVARVGHTLLLFQRPIVLVPQTHLTVRCRPVPLWSPRDEGSAGGCWVHPVAVKGRDGRAPGPRPTPPMHRDGLS